MGEDKIRPRSSMKRLEKLEGGHHVVQTLPGTAARVK